MIVVVEKVTVIEQFPSEEQASRLACGWVTIFAVNHFFELHNECRKIVLSVRTNIFRSHRTGSTGRAELMTLHKQPASERAVVSVRESPKANAQSKSHLMGSSIIYSGRCFSTFDHHQEISTILQSTAVSPVHYRIRICAFRAMNNYGTSL